MLPSHAVDLIDAVQPNSNASIIKPTYLWTILSSSEATILFPGLTKRDPSPTKAVFNKHINAKHGFDESSINRL
jgi:hypothetical protein